MCSQNAQLGLFYIKRFHVTPLLFGKNWKKKRFLLTLVQQLQLTEILHCTKLPQNIKIKILCDISWYTRKILQSRTITCFDTSAILNLSLQGQQSRPNPTFFKMAFFKMVKEEITEIVSNNCQLTGLIIPYAFVDDNTVMYIIESLKNLRQICVCETSVSQACVDRMQRRKPCLDICWNVNHMPWQETF